MTPLLHSKAGADEVVVLAGGEAGGEDGRDDPVHDVSALTPSRWPLTQHRGGAGVGATRRRPGGERLAPPQSANARERPRVPVWPERRCAVSIGRPDRQTCSAGAGCQHQADGVITMASWMNTGVAACWSRAAPRWRTSGPRRGDPHAPDDPRLFPAVGYRWIFMRNRPLGLGEGVGRPRAPWVLGAMTMTGRARRTWVRRSRRGARHHLEQGRLHLAGAG